MSNNGKKNTHDENPFPDIPVQITITIKTEWEGQIITAEGIGKGNAKSLAAEPMVLATEVLTVMGNLVASYQTATMSLDDLMKDMPPILQSAARPILAEIVINEVVKVANKVVNDDEE